MSIVDGFLSALVGTSVTSVWPMKTILRKSSAAEVQQNAFPGCRGDLAALYQRELSAEFRRPTPESWDSIANGTRIFPFQVVGRRGVG